MSDLYDDASDLEMLHREMSIKRIRSQKTSKITGFCVTCNVPLQKGMFCDSWCKEDYEMEQKIKRITGEH